MSERREAIEVARGLLRRKRRGSDILSESEEPLGKAAVDWRDIPELRVLRSADALYEEFLRRKDAGDPKEIAALLYAAMKFPEHPQAVDMLNCCAFNRVLSAQNSQHLAQALRGFTLALRMAPAGEPSWKVANNRVALLNLMSLSTVVLRDAGMLLTTVPAGHMEYSILCSNLGEAYTCLGRNELAALAYERALVSSEDRPVAQDQIKVSLARAYVRLGRISDAQELLTRLSDAVFSHRLALEAEISLGAGDYAVCIKQAGAALRGFPVQAPWSIERKAIAEIHRLLATAYRRLGNEEQAGRHIAVSQVLGASFGLTGSDAGFGNAG